MVLFVFDYLKAKILVLGEMVFQQKFFRPKVTKGFDTWRQKKLNCNFFLNFGKILDGRYEL